MAVGLLIKPGKPEALEIAHELIALLRERGLDAWIAGVPDGTFPDAREVPETALHEVELLVVLGGDGTLLHGAELVTDAGVPILGINLGNVGFLTSSPPEQAMVTLGQALDHKLPLEKRLRLRVEIVRADGERVVRYACNDVVLSQGALARLIDFEAFLDEMSIANYRADGLIIATPTGSTAYSLAAGGPILTPDLEAVVLSPICPHMLTNRPVVVPASSRLRVQLGEAARNVMLTLDGQWGTSLDTGDRVMVRAANRPLLLHRPLSTDYFEILRTKLHWGERVGPGRASSEATSGTPRR